MYFCIRRISDCNNEITSHPEETKCQYQGSTCKEIDLCSFAASFSKEVCETIPALEFDKQKFIFDSSTTKCIIKTLYNK